MSCLLEVKNAEFGYNVSGKGIVPVISNVSLSIAGGECILLSGANGCGKSTIIRGILGIAATIKGDVVCNVDRQKLGYVSQESIVDHDIPATALDVLRAARPFAWNNVKKEAFDMLASTGIGEAANRRYGTLSGGQKRRTLIARALMGSPELLILDEPTIYADREAVYAMEELLVKLLSENKIGILAVTHNEKWEKFGRVYDVEKRCLVG